MWRSVWYNSCKYVTVTNLLSKPLHVQNKNICKDKQLKERQNLLGQSLWKLQRYNWWSAGFLFYQVLSIFWSAL